MQRWGRFRRAAFTIVCVLVVVVGYSRMSAQPPRSSRLMLYASVGPELTWYDVDVERAALARQGSAMLPANVQEASADPSRRYLYVAWSNGGPSYVAPGSGLGSAGSRHGVSAFRIDGVSGALVPHGQSALPSRPIHITTDVPGTHILVAYNDPSGVTVHRIQPDGTIGAQVTQQAGLDVGIYGHQVRVDPSNKSVILVTRGNNPTREKAEDPGALKVFAYRDGVLSNRASIAPGGGFGFQSRHLDFHPTRPWVFVSLERQNKLQVYKKLTDEALSSEPLFTKETLSAPDTVRAGQAASTVHVHPTGEFVYLANRASGTTNVDGKPVFAGGENAIAVFKINEDTGEPTLIQNIDTRGVQPRTFAVDSSGRILVAANQAPFSVRDGHGVSMVPASLAIFRVRADGKLDFVRKHDVEASNSRSLFWMGLVSLP